MAVSRNLSVAAIAARILIGGFSILVIVWGVFAAWIFSLQAPVESVAKFIIAENAFKLESLMVLKRAYATHDGQGISRVPVLGAAATLNLRLLELAIERGDQKNIDTLIKETIELTRQSLVNSPSDPFLWTVLFWLENVRNGFSAKHLEYLKMSYATGPNEGWVAVKRNRFGLAVFSSLKPELEANVVSEFGRLVGSNYFSAAADILGGPGWPVREKLLPELRNLDEVDRETFAKLIYRRGFDLVVPGVDRPDWRPWH